MAYTTLEGQQQLLGGIAGAIDELGYALACLGAAYELLDDATADALEEQLFGPAQKAYGRAKRTYSDFGRRCALPEREFEPQVAGGGSVRARALIDDAVAALGNAGMALSAVQDEPALLEVGDADLRAGLADVRARVDALPAPARELVRRLGR